jgi:hypothetical protein
MALQLITSLCRPSSWLRHLQSPWHPVSIATFGATSLLEIESTACTHNYKQYRIYSSVDSNEAKSSSKKKIAVGQMTSTGDVDKNFETCKMLAKVAVVVDTLIFLH